MKFKFKVQNYQTEAVKAVIDVFKGQNKLGQEVYRRDTGTEAQLDDTGYKNKDITLSKEELLKNIHKVQQRNCIKQSQNITTLGGNCACTLDVEMETGTGKTYVYIKSIFELNKEYGFTKFIIVVPSIAIREGVKKNFEMTKDHFLELYGKQARHFIYDSKKLEQIDHFSSNYNIDVMIINMQAFNRSLKELKVEKDGSKKANSKENHIIYNIRDNFGTRRPIDVIAANRPILILDEPQKMSGDSTQKALLNFNPLFCLNYSATHKVVNNRVYILDPIDAYNQRLVKKIEVKGTEIKNLLATSRYLYLEEIHLSPNKPPRAKIEIEVKLANKIVRKQLIAEVGSNLYTLSKELKQYNDIIITNIDAREDHMCIELSNGEKIHKGELVGDNTEETIRRIQIRETIKSHFEKEENLYNMGIKSLSLFFIDEVAKYRKYDNNNAILGEYGKIFEEEYLSILNSYKTMLDTPYQKYLASTCSQVDKVHNAYFSIDKKSGKSIDSKSTEKKTTDEDISAYELILKDKERLLSFEEPTRFIFSHSALREGWDNPNVFQICTLKHSENASAKRQEVGRGLRLCVDQDGNRYDAETRGDLVHDTNLLTVIASESYKSFVTDLQKDISNDVKDADRPTQATKEYFVNKVLNISLDSNLANDTQSVKITDSVANLIEKYLVKNDYSDERTNEITAKYKEDKDSNALVPLSDMLKEEILNGIKIFPMPLEDMNLSEEEIQKATALAEEKITQSVQSLIQSVYCESIVKNMFSNAHSKTTINTKLNDNFHKEEFKKLWSYINKKYVYRVDFDSEELIKNAVKSINGNLFVGNLSYTIQMGEQKEKLNENDITNLTSFTSSKTKSHALERATTSQVEYDLLGEVAKITKLTRTTVANILTNIDKVKFDMFRYNPEDFIPKVSKLIQAELATMVVEHISYTKSAEEPYDSSIFTLSTKQDFTNAIEAKKHIQDYVIADSNVERTFANALEIASEVAVYAKLPRGFNIPTPVGNYAPDWAIAFNKGEVKHIYFIAETKGSLDSMDLRKIEEAKIECAKKHFEALSKDCSEIVKYNAVTSYEDLLKDLM